VPGHRCSSCFRRTGRATTRGAQPLPEPGTVLGVSPCDSFRAALGLDMGFWQSVFERCSSGAGTTLASTVPVARAYTQLPACTASYVRRRDATVNPTLVTIRRRDVIDKEREEQARRSLKADGREHSSEPYKPSLNGRARGLVAGRLSKRRRKSLLHIAASVRDCAVVLCITAWYSRRRAGAASAVAARGQSFRLLLAVPC
jgi:hypothetical protein